MTERCSAKADSDARRVPGLDASPLQSPPAGHLLPAFVASLLALPLDDEVRHQVRQLLALHAGERVTFPSEQRLAAARRFEVARSMLQLQVPRAAVLSMLVRRFGICARQARRDVAAIVRTDGHDAANDTVHSQEPPHHATSV